MFTLLWEGLHLDTKGPFIITTLPPGARTPSFAPSSPASSGPARDLPGLACGMGLAPALRPRGRGKKKCHLLWVFLILEASDSGDRFCRMLLWELEIFLKSCPGGCGLYLYYATPPTPLFAFKTPLRLSLISRK